MITIVAVVAIVGLVTLFLNTGKQPPMMTLAPLEDTADGNMAGQAISPTDLRHRKPIGAPQVPNNAIVGPEERK